MTEGEKEGHFPLDIRLAGMLEKRGCGWTPEQIAAEYYLTKGTVVEYLRQARKKLGVNTLEEAVAEAERRGLIDLSVPHPGPRPVRRCY